MHWLDGEVFLRQYTKLLSGELYNLAPTCYIKTGLRCTILHWIGGLSNNTVNFM